MTQIPVADFGADPLAAAAHVGESYESRGYLAS